MSWADTQRLLALTLPLAFVSIIILLIFIPLQPENPTTSMVNTLVGVLGGMATTVTTFYFGSSKGSSDKDAQRDSTLNALVNKVTNGAPRDVKP